MERHCDADLHRNRFAVLRSGSELPFLHGIHGGLIKVGTEGTITLDVARQTVGADHNLYHDRPFLMLVARLCRVLGIWGKKHVGWLHSSPRSVDRLRCSLSRVILAKQREWLNKGCYLRKRK